MKKWFCIILLAAMLLPGEASPCTIFTAWQDKTVLFAGNEDQTPNPSYLVVDKTGKYGVVFLATPMPAQGLVMQMGVNDQGLVYDINTIGSEKLVPTPKALKQKEWALVTLMRESGSVKELLTGFFKYDWGTSIAYQIHVADRFGDAAVIHPGKDGKLTFTRIDKARGYLISTNFNVRDAGFMSMVSSRYLTADNSLKKLTSGTELSENYMASILKATHQTPNLINPQKTIYSTVVNLNSLDIHLYYDSNFNKSYLLNVRSELSKTSGKRIVPLTEVIASMDT